MTMLVRHLPVLRPALPRPTVWRVLVLALLFAATALPAHRPAHGAELAPAGTAAPTGPVFDILQFVVSGNSLLSALAVEQVLARHTGPGRRLADVEAARAALAQAYQARGHMTVLVTIPEQDVGDGEVALQVTEAVIDQVTVQGAEYTRPPVLRSRLPALQSGTAPDFLQLQAELAAVNRSGDTRVTPVLKAGRLPGTVDVQLDVDDQLALHGSTELNNRQTPNTTAARWTGTLHYDNLWQRGHSLGLSAQLAPQRPDDARVLTANYSAPVGLAGQTLTLLAVASRSAFASLANAPGLGLLGNTRQLGLRWAQALGMPPGQPDAADTTPVQHTLTAGLDHKQVGQTLTLVGGPSTATPITYAPVQLGLNTQWLATAAQPRSTGLDLTMVLGLRGWLGNSEAHFQAKRANASASFVALRAALQHGRPLGQSGWTLSTRWDAQLASGPLVPTEQMTAGGADSVRGYLEAERAADNGLRGTLELRSPGWQPQAGQGPAWAGAWRVTGLGFIDAAWLQNLQVLAPTAARHRLLGAGLGLRANGPRNLTVEADLAEALLAGDATARRALRAHARLLWGF